MKYVLYGDYCTWMYWYYEPILRLLGPMRVGRDGNVLIMPETWLWVPLMDSKSDTLGGDRFLVHSTDTISHRQLKEARWEICLAGMTTFEILPD